MFEKQKAFFHGLREIFRNPYLLEQQTRKADALDNNLKLAEDMARYHSTIVSHKQDILDHAQEAIQERLSTLTQTAMERLPAEKVYEILRPWDEDGFSLYFAANELLGVDPSNYFTTEDSLGYFSDANGAKLLKYAEIAKFADKNWKQLSGPGAYEVLDSYDLHTDTPEYRQYRERLWPLAVQKTVERFKRVLLDENGMDKVFQVMDALTGAIREAPEPDAAKHIQTQQQPSWVEQAAVYQPRMPKMVEMEL